MTMTGSKIDKSIEKKLLNQVQEEFVSGSVINKGGNQIIKL